MDSFLDYLVMVDDHLGNALSKARFVQIFSLTNSTILSIFVGSSLYSALPTMSSGMQESAACAQQYPHVRNAYLFF